MIITKSNDSLKDVEILLEDMESYLWFNLKISLDDHNIDPNEDNYYAQPNQYSNLVILQNKILENEDNNITYLEVFKLRCLCN